MALDINEFTLNLDEVIPSFELTAKQFDTTGARSFRFNVLKDNEKYDLTGYKISVGAKKEDSKVILNDVQIIDPTNGIIELDLTSQMLVVDGVLKLEFLFFKNNILLSSYPFEIRIIPSVTNFNVIESSNEFLTLIKMLSQLSGFDEKMKTLTDVVLGGKLLNNPFYNIAILNTVRNGVKCNELWLLINARYDYEAKRFKRINVNDFSFGWQMQGGGTYPGEEAIGDVTNQGMNLWKANGKHAYGVNDPSRDLTGEDIGAWQSDGSWREFGIMLGWNNVFMNDSYGGMTIGGSGFEIDGSGTSPFKRLSLGKFSGGSIDPNKKPQDYVFTYNGTCWNTQHGLWNMDVKETDSFFWGMESPINWYDNPNKTFDPYSNRADLTQAKYVIKRLPANKDSKFENWENVLEIDCKNNEGKIGGKPIVTTLTVSAQIVNTTDFNMAYPNATFNKNNTFILGVKGIQADGSVKQFGNINATFTDYGIYGYLGNGFKSAEIILGKH